MFELPVFQMTLLPRDNGTFGLIFSEELYESGFAQPVFTIPIKHNQTFWWENQYYFPGEIRGEYVDFNLKREGSLFYINHQSLDLSIRFQAENRQGYMSNLFQNEQFIDLFYRLEYIGEQKDFIHPFLEFIVISPIDLLIMDSLYLKQQACFVGLTPVFGKRRSYQG